MRDDPDSLKRRIRALGITQADFARICGVTDVTVRRYLMDPERHSNARPAHPTVLRVLTWLEGGFRPPEWPDR